MEAAGVKYSDWLLLRICADFYRPRVTRPGTCLCRMFELGGRGRIQRRA